MAATRRRHFRDIDRQPAVAVVQREGDFYAVRPLPRVPDPAKIMSSSFFARRRRPDCSPSTQRNASAMFDFPEPLGPTMAVMPCPNSNVVRTAKLLNPWRSSRFRYNLRGPLFACSGECLQCLPGRV